MSNADDVGRLSRVRAHAPVDLSLRLKTPQRQWNKNKISQFVCAFLIRFLTGAKGAVDPWWQRELGLDVASVQMHSGLVWS